MVRARIRVTHVAPFTVKAPLFDQGRNTAYP
jgi:hypothetical protein